jgi:excinuclease ABC subunit A
LVEAGNTVIVVEHNMRVVAASDWVIDIGPGAGEEGGRVVVAGPPATVAATAASRTAPYLQRFMDEGSTARSEDKRIDTGIRKRKTRQRENEPDR